MKTCVLIVKDAPRSTGVNVDFAGLRVGRRFVVGYGLDLDGRYRDLDCIAVISGPSAPDSGPLPNA